MTITQVFFTSRQRAESLEARPDMAVISITDPGMPPARLSVQFQHVLRLSFFDAVPADEYLPAPLPGLFDHPTAAQIDHFIQRLHETPESLLLTVHCEHGVSRSAAVALFAEAYSGAPLRAREFTYEANLWVLDLLLRRHPALNVDLPAPEDAIERREKRR